MRPTSKDNMSIIKCYSPPFQFAVIMIRKMTMKHLEKKVNVIDLADLQYSTAGTNMHDHTRSSRRHSGGCVGRHRPFLGAALSDLVTPSEARLPHSLTTSTTAMTTGRAD